MNNKKSKGGRNPKLDPATNRITVNFTSKEYNSVPDDVRAPWNEQQGDIPQSTILRADISCGEFRQIPA